MDRSTEQRLGLHLMPAKRVTNTALVNRTPWTCPEGHRYDYTPLDERTHRAFCPCCLIDELDSEWGPQP